MSDSDKPRSSPILAIVTILLNGLTAVVAIAWMLFLGMAMAMGSPGPSAIQYLEVFWPALAGLALVLASLLCVRKYRWPAMLLGLTGMMLILVMFYLMVGVQMNCRPPKTTGGQPECGLFR